MTEPQIPIYLADGLPRRTFLKTLGIASGSLMLSGLPSLQAQTGQSGTSTFQIKAPEPNPKHGGTLRYGILSAPAHFDVHQSGTVSNMAAQGPMYDNLIRRHPMDCQTIIPDLAQSWEIAPDGKTYTFFLRQGVQFTMGLISPPTMRTPPSRASSFPRRVLAAHVRPCFRLWKRSTCATPIPSSSSCVRRGRRILCSAPLPAAGTSSCAKRRWRITITACARSKPSPAQARSSTSSALIKKSDHGEKPQLLE